jgi:hypothetical protein
MQPLFTFARSATARDLAACGTIWPDQDVMTRERLYVNGAGLLDACFCRRGEGLACKLRKDYQKLLDDVERDSLKRTRISPDRSAQCQTSLYTVDSLYRSRWKLSARYRSPAGNPAAGQEQSCMPQG